jgi:2-iminobutanoate/2-iminopropanoate deaminase
MNNNRRTLLKTAVGAAAVASTASVSSAQTGTTKKIHYLGAKPTKPTLFSPAVSYGNLLFIAGQGAHVPGDITKHTEIVLDQIKKLLENAGSSMEKVLQCRVFLDDLKDFEAMNKVFMGKFGPEPPVRTTIATKGGIPGNSLVEIDVVAYI